MKILGISTSRRKWGNTDLLVASVLKAGAMEGAEVKLLRPADLDLKPCNGCMRCVFKGCDCVIEDRFSEVYEALRWADAVVLGAPTYVLTPNSVQKNVQDRLIQLGRSHEMRGKLGLCVVTAGIPAWEGFALELATQQLLFLGIKVIDRFVGHAQGPGEILDDAAALGRAARGGRALAKGEGAYLGEPGICPVCNLDLVTVAPGGRGRCQICDIEGEIHNGRLTPPVGALSRLERAMVDHHFNERVLPSGPRFKERVKEYLTRTAEFRRGFEEVAK